MADLFQHLTNVQPELLVLGWVALLAAHVYGIIRLRRRRRDAGNARRPSDVSSTQYQASLDQASLAARIMPRDNASAQIHRLFGILETSAASVERAMSAHRSAAKHLDSAEYQLLKLFDEFPMLAANRGASKVLTSVGVAAPVASASHALAA